MSAPAFDLDRIGGRRAFDALVDEVLGAGEDAVRALRDGAARRVMTKPDRSPVTEADQAVETRLRGFMERRFAHVGFVGEETGTGNADAALRFIVDPIDGTRAFVRGLPTWSILVGLEADGEPVAGIAHFPASGDLFVGVRGHGAYGNGRPLRVSAIDSLDGALIAHGSLQQFTAAGFGAMLTHLGERTHTQRGFADFDGYRQMLWGRADGMVDPSVQPWDLCAAAVLIREAGGRFTDLAGNETIYAGIGVASNGVVHDALLDVLHGR